MKKIMILMAGALALGTAATAQITFAPEAGVNLANMHFKETVNGNDIKDDGGLKIGVKVGLNVNIPVSDHLTIQPGLFYSIKGYKEDIGGTSNNLTIHWADIAANVQYLFNDPGEGRFFIGVGPYLGIAFKGTDKTTGGLGGDQSVDIHFGNDEPSNDLRRFDIGGQANVGYMLKSGLMFRVMGQQSIGNLAPQGNKPAGYGDGYIRQTNITISVGYVLGGKK